MPKKRIKTFEEALQAQNVIFKAPEGATPDEIAYMKLKIITKALNEGWEPDWNNWSEWKYYPYFKMSDNGAAPGVGFSYFDFGHDLDVSFVGSRLCFKSRELAEYAGKTFASLYKDFLLINK